MTTLNFDLKNVSGKIKPMHAVNNGPLHSAPTQKRSNLEAYRAARIPYARNHDASYYHGYGGEFIVDVHRIFRDFDADENDPASYDFYYTDEYIGAIQKAGCETYYRLGETIEWGSKKYTSGCKTFADFERSLNLYWYRNQQTQRDVQREQL